MQFLHSVDVILLAVVAKLGAAHACLGKSILHVIHYLGRCLCLFCTITAKGEHLLHIFAILLLLFLACSVGVKIVVAVGQAHSAAVHVEHVHVAVEHVGRHAYSEERIAQIHVLVCYFLGQIRFLESLGALQVGKHRLCALFVEAHAIHCQIVEINHFLAV